MVRYRERTIHRTQRQERCEIYEGDVIGYKNSSPNCPDSVFTVSWDNKQAGFCETYSTYVGDGSFLCSGRVQVIGNIYQNPELLK